MPCKFSNLSLFIFLTSLPLLFFMVFYEKLLEKTLLESIKILNPPSDYYNMFDWQVHRYWKRRINPEFSTRLIFPCLLCFIPLHLLELLSTITTVHLSSKMHTGESSFTFRDIRTTWLHKERLKGVFLTSIYVLSLSACALLGFLWLLVYSYTMARTFFFDLVFTVFYPVAILALLVKFLEISAVWNMSMVISALEEVDGARAFSLAFYFNRGSERRGLLLMFVFFALGLGLRVPCLYEGEDQAIRIVARTSLLWVVHLVKWVVFTGYYIGCKNRVLQKKVDVEAGGRFGGESSKTAQ